MSDRRSDDNKVICPECNNEFQAIPVSVQEELESLRQRVKELEAKAEINYAIMAGDSALITGLKEELAALKQGQGEPRAWEACCPGPIYAREVFKTKAEAESCSDAWDSCFIAPLYTSAPTIPEGWVMVPVKPTPEMIEAGRPMTEGDYSLPFHLWKQMITAAPKPEE